MAVGHIPPHRVGAKFPENAVNGGRRKGNGAKRGKTDLNRLDGLHLASAVFGHHVGQPGTGPAAGHIRNAGILSLPVKRPQFGAEAAQVDDVDIGCGDGRPGYIQRKNFGQGVNHHRRSVGHQFTQGRLVCGVEGDGRFRRQAPVRGQLPGFGQVNIGDDNLLKPVGSD